MSAINAHKNGPGAAGSQSAGASASAASTFAASEAAAMEHVNAGLKLEIAGDAKGAIDAYNTGCTMLMQLLKATPDTQKTRDDRERILKSLKAYIGRAEQLKSQSAAAAEATAFVQSSQKVTRTVAGGVSAPTASSAAKLKAKTKPTADRKSANSKSSMAVTPKKGSAAAASEESAPAATVASPDSKIDPALRALIEGEILDNETKVSFSDVIGLSDVKQSLHEMVILPRLRPDLFSGLRRPPKGLLMYGPPGNGKTFIAKAVAREAKCTFFSISAASLVSKWLGEGEKLMRTLFAVARERAPAIIFIDEIDSILSKRKENEHDAARRLKTEFLIQFDGAGSESAAAKDGGDDGVVIIGATNMPESLDDAVIRRLNRQIFVPSPDAATRTELLKRLLHKQSHSLTPKDMERVIAATEGFSASDITALAREAAYGPIRELGSVAAVVALPSASALKPITLQHFLHALKSAKPSVSPERMKLYEAFKKQQSAAAV